MLARWIFENFGCLRDLEMVVGVRRELKGNILLVEVGMYFLGDDGVLGMLKLYSRQFEWSRMSIFFLLLSVFFFQWNNENRQK